MLTLFEKYQRAMDRTETILTQTNDGGFYNGSTLDMLAYNNRTFANYYYFDLGDIEKTKQCFYNVATIIQHAYQHFPEERFPFRFDRICQTLLSDDSFQIEALNYYNNSDYMKHLAQSGSTVYAFLAMLREDTSTITQQIDLLTNHWLSKKSKQWIKPEVDFLKAYLSTDPSGMEASIMAMLKSRKYMAISAQSNNTGDRLIDFPAVGYVKLAWRKGFEIEIDHPKIPKNLQPIRPLENYSTYEFLRLKGNSE